MVFVFVFVSVRGIYEPWTTTVWFLTNLCRPYVPDTQLTDQEHVRVGRWSVVRASGDFKPFLGMLKHPYISSQHP